MKKMISKSKAAAAVMKEHKMNCAQTVVTSFSEELGIERDLAFKIAMGFGGGMGRTARTCGAVTGAYIVLGLAQEISPTVTVSIMSQYYPCHLAVGIPALARIISSEEYSAVVKLLEKLGLENGWLQEMDASNNYLPDFTRKGHPFLQTEGEKKT